MLLFLFVTSFSLLIVVVVVVVMAVVVGLTCSGRVILWRNLGTYRLETFPYVEFKK